MKELSIEEKAKRYDEALIRGSRLWESGSITLEDYEYMFPEHKESEDEKIRKEIISFVTWKSLCMIGMTKPWRIMTRKNWLGLLSLAARSGRIK